MNMSRISNTPGFGFNYGLRIKSWKIKYNFKWNQPNFEPRLKFKPRLKFFEFGLGTIF